MSLALLKTGCFHLGVLTPRGRKLHPGTRTVVAAPVLILARRDPGDNRVDALQGSNCPQVTIRVRLLFVIDPGDHLPLGPAVISMQDRERAVAPL